MSRILCVGIATLDIINHVAEYPVEDSELRALSQSRRMGGNAANTAVLLSQLGHTVSWVGNLGPGGDIVEETFRQHRVDAAAAVRLTTGGMPTSYVTLSESTGSRSIVHHRDLPEYEAASPSGHVTRSRKTARRHRGVVREGRCAADLVCLRAKSRVRERDVRAQKSAERVPCHLHLGCQGGLGCR